MVAVGVLWSSVVPVPEICESALEGEISPVEGVLVIARSVLEGGTTPVEAAVSDIWDVSAFCAVARVASKR